MTTAKEQFDRQARHYNAQWNTWTEASLHWLLTHANCQPTDEVLDVATGTGFTALAFAPRVRSVVGLDVSTGMLAQARQHQAEAGLANITWQEGAAEALPFADDTFSMVTCRIAPHHFESVPRFLAEVARVLRPGGRFLLADTTVPDNDPATAAWQNRVEALRDPSHRRNLAPQQWRQAIETAGLDVAEIGVPGPEATMQLNDWLTRAGCPAEQAAAVRTAFATAPEAARSAFRIQPLANEGYAFCWQRLVARATKR
ncbi:class I SAM-dependent methyltransferase [Hymenobacter fastidiosus]|uniref:Class I SAM-dependent methyltransferase n=1 Tax=Hymenobacter fastidiosus TaxID=486264 RepID=A0ABP7RLY2_9BACT